MIQELKQHYYSKQYDNFERWISYWHQIETTINLGEKNLLEIGVGNKTVSNYLKSIGVKTLTLDFDKSLNPDLVSDIRKLALKSNEFDAILCCEVLEHLPFEEAKIALKEINRVTKKYAVISIPHHCACFYFSFKIPFVNRKDFYVRIPIIGRSFHREHYWEIDMKKYSLNNIKDLFMQSNFEIANEFTPSLFCKHHFFTLIKKIT